MAIDIETGLDDFFKAQGSSEAQRADAIAVLKSQCAMTGDVVTLKETGEALDSEASRKWLQTNKPHLLPPVYERSLAERAFVDGNGMARNALVKQVGKAEADKIAQQYGLKSAHDTRRGTAPASDDDASKKKNGAADHRNNPWHSSNWNISKQGALLRAVGTEKAAAMARAVGSTIGATRPNPNY